MIAGLWESHKYSVTILKLSNFTIYLLIFYIVTLLKLLKVLITLMNSSLFRQWLMSDSQGNTSQIPYRLFIEERVSKFTSFIYSYSCETALQILLHLMVALCKSIKLRRPSVVTHQMRLNLPCSLTSFQICTWIMCLSKLLIFLF